MTASLDRSSPQPPRSAVQCIYRFFLMSDLSADFSAVLAGDLTADFLSSALFAFAPCPPAFASGLIPGTGGATRLTGATIGSI